VVVQSGAVVSPWSCSIQVHKGVHLPKVHVLKALESYLKLRVGHGVTAFTAQSTGFGKGDHPTYECVFPPFSLEQVFTPVTLEVWDHEKSRADILVSSVSLSASEICRLAFKAGQQQQALQAPTFSFDYIAPLKTKKKRLTKVRLRRFSFRLLTV
jgi:hypothetical protein